MAAEFCLTRRVQFSETDLAGVMHFSNYFRWMEDIEHAFWRSRESTVIIREGNATISWPRVAVACEYFAPVRFEDEVELRLRLATIGEKSLTFEVDFFHQGRRVAAGRTTAACCAMQSGEFRPIPIPASARQKLSAEA